MQPSFLFACTKYPHVHRGSVGDSAPCSASGTQADKGATILELLHLEHSASSVTTAKRERLEGPTRTSPGGKLHTQEHTAFHSPWGRTSQETVPNCTGVGTRGQRTGISEALPPLPQPTLRRQNMSLLHGMPTVSRQKGLETASVSFGRKLVK